MFIELPDDIIRRADASMMDCRIAIAVELYADNRVDHADACRLSGLTPAQFGRELADRAISIQRYPSRRPPARAG